MAEGEDKAPELDGWGNPKPPPYVPPEEGIRERIKAKREELGLNIEELARLTQEYDYTKPSKGISASMLRRYEYEYDKGGSKPGARELCLLCEALGVTADWLLLGKAPPPPDPRIKAGIDIVAAIDTLIRLREVPANLLAGHDAAEQRMFREEKVRRAKLPKLDHDT